MNCNSDFAVFGVYENGVYPFKHKLRPTFPDMVMCPMGAAHVRTVFILPRTCRGALSFIMFMGAGLLSADNPDLLPDPISDVPLPDLAKLVDDLRTGLIYPLLFFSFSPSFRSVCLWDAADPLDGSGAGTSLFVTVCQLRLPVGDRRENLLVALVVDFDELHCPLGVAFCVVRVFFVVIVAIVETVDHVIEK